ncbi:MAG: DUF1844 domain-containing protein [Bacteroidales bacterium]|nr:DUF1844 domain-containing protein [Bacteroidales bacterium]
MDKNDQLFLQFLYIFHASAMQAMGKIKNPVTDKVEKNMEQAKQAIEMIEMIKEKTNNNLSADLSKALQTFISELKLNYVEELNKN